MPFYLASCSINGIFFHVSSTPFNWSGGSEKTLTVELFLLISFKTRKAATVLLTWRLSTNSCSSVRVSGKQHAAFEHRLGFFDELLQQVRSVKRLPENFLDVRQTHENFL
ncbi:hypothetical protein Bca4012_011653 [Brassica carinata]